MRAPAQTQFERDMLKHMDTTGASLQSLSREFCLCRKCVPERNHAPVKPALPDFVPSRSGEL